MAHPGPGAGGQTRVPNHLALLLFRAALRGPRPAPAYPLELSKSSSAFCVSSHVN